MKMESFVLDQTSSIAFTCDYNKPTISLDFYTSGMSCNLLYTNSTIQNNFNRTFNAFYIESIRTLTTLKARRCFKLKLTTSCQQRWLLPNIVSRSTETLTVSRDECYSLSACIGCEVANTYPQEDCEVFTFGKNNVEKILVFAKEVDVYQNVIGEVSYNSLSTFDDYFNLGGSYAEKVFFSKGTLADPVFTNFIINPTTKDIIHFSSKRLMKFSNESMRFQDREWYLYEGSHLISKVEVDKEIIDISSTTPQTSGLFDGSYQRYQDFFLNAQINITNWYLNYLDCRLKKLSFGLFQAFNNISKLSPLDQMFEEVLDLGPGEIINNDKMTKYDCFRVVVGELISKNGCIIYRHNQKMLNISNIGELTDLPSCAKFVRVNSTHIIRPSIDDTLTLLEYRYLSLVEEEKTLENTPKLVDSIGYIIELVKNASSLNIRRNSYSNTTSVKSQVDSSNSSFSFWGWIKDFVPYAVYTVIGATFVFGAIFLVVLFLRTLKNKPRSTKNKEPLKEKELGKDEDSKPKKTRSRAGSKGPKQVEFN